MMLRTFLLMLGVLAASICHAQNEKFFVEQNSDNLIIRYTVKKGETPVGLARMFHVPPNIFTDMNHLGQLAQLSPGTTVDIPIAAYNHINEAPEYMGDVRPLYYKVNGRESMSRIVRITGVPQRKIEKWNNLPNNVLRDGQELMVGWVLYDATQIKQRVKEPDVVVRTSGDWSTRASRSNSEKDVPERTLDNLQPDTIATIYPFRDTSGKAKTAEEELYMSQTLNEQRIITEKGPAAFFTSGSTSKTYYAFHSTLRRGSIIKISNPGNGKWVFAKVIGTIPATAQYHNCIIGISAAAKRDLGVNDAKMFCEITYGVL